MSINLVMLNHWLWSHLNADMADTCLNKRNGFFLFFFGLLLNSINLFFLWALLLLQAPSVHLSPFKAHSAVSSAAAEVCSLGAASPLHCEEEN